MLVLIGFAFVAGIVTILSPCILPILPIVLSGSLTGGKSRPLGVVLGFILSFTFFATFSFALANAIGLSTSVLRQISVVLLIIFGLSIVIPKFQEWLELFASRFIAKHQVKNRSGFTGGVIVGISLGLIWTPCVGPILASVLTLAASSQITLDLILITLSYSIGTAIPLLMITYGGQRIIKKLPKLRENASQIQRVFGVLVIITALLIHFNLDRKFQTYILDTFPQYGEGLTSIEDNEAVQEQLDELRSGDEDDEEGGSSIFDVGQMQQKLYPNAPNRDFEGATKWVNSEPLTLDKLEGQVVLVDFWTYTCINCIRTFPYVTSWYEKYKDDGFVIIGVHTPEFEFEKDEDNVLEAMEEYGITYPVVQDNEFKIWRSYKNRYWPAHYLIDKKGKIRYTHFGEGEYDVTEAKIQELLEEDGPEIDKELLDMPSNLPTYRRTPESYLGYARIDRFASPQNIAQDLNKEYTTPPGIPKHYLAYEGTWNVGRERALAANNAAIELNFEAKEVYLVMRPSDEADGGRVRVLLDGNVVSESEAGEDVDGEGYVVIDSDQLYKLIKLDSVENRQLRLEFPNGGVEVFAFTFG